MDAVQRSLHQALDSAGVRFSDINLGVMTHSRSHFLGAQELAGFGHTCAENPERAGFLCFQRVSGIPVRRQDFLPWLLLHFAFIPGCNPLSLSQGSAAPHTVVAGVLTRDGAAAHAVLTTSFDPEKNDKRLEKARLELSSCSDRPRSQRSQNPDPDAL